MFTYTLLFINITILSTLQYPNIRTNLIYHSVRFLNNKITIDGLAINKLEIFLGLDEF